MTRQIIRIAVMVACPVAFAQAQQAPLTLRVNTQLVEINAVVTDGRGNPVADLKPGDFEVYDKGKKQEIKVFRVEDFRQRGGALQSDAATAPPAPGVFSNRPRMEAAAQGPATVIVIDLGSTWDPARMLWPDLVYARDQLIQFLRQVHPDDRLGIYLMGRKRFWILREYNQTCAELLERLATWHTPAEAPSAAKALDVWTEFAMHFAGVDMETARAIHRAQFWKSSAGGSEALPEGTRDSSDPTVSTAHGRQGGLIGAPDVGGMPRGLGPEARNAGFGPGREAYLTPQQDWPLAVLEAAAHHLESVPGRKNLILISANMFLPEEFKDQLPVLRDLIQTGVAVYTIDPGGLAPYTNDASFVIPSQLAGFIAKGGGDREVLRYINSAEGIKHQVSLFLQSSLEILADATGGKSFVNTNDIKRAIVNSFEDSRVTYTLGFYPRTNNDGSYHNLKVKISGREHLSVRCREGYFEPEPPLTNQKRLDSELRTAIWRPVDATAIELTGSMLPSLAENSYLVRLNVGLANLSLKPEQNRWSGQVEVNLVGRDNEGNTYNQLMETFGLNLRQDSYDRLVKDGLPYSKTITLDPKASSLRVIVRDKSSGNIGTLTIPL